MVAGILRVVFNDKDQGVLCVNAVGDGLNQQSDRIVVIRILQLRRDQSESAGVGEASGVVVHKANQAQRRQSARGVVGVEIAQPLLVTVIVRELVVEAAKVWIGEWGKGNVLGVGHLGFG